MFRMLNQFVTVLKNSARPSRTRRLKSYNSSGVAAMVEIVESRQVMSATPITDMTEWGRQFAGPAHPQVLWLNFDGKHNEGNNIEAFVPPNGKDADTTIQDILYQVQETFSPFNVQVRRRSGDGNYSSGNGDTTIFVGGNSSNLTTTSTTSGLYYRKKAAAFTPYIYCDNPTASRINHAPNSDPFDLAFVDPMNAEGYSIALTNPANWRNSWDTTTLVSNIAHEAGHTFGLVHVRTDGLSDPNALGTSTLGDIMSYNTDLPQTYFANRSLPVTNWNYQVSTGLKIDSAIQPKSHLEVPLPGRILSIPINITTENTFTYLQTVLGARGSDGYCHVTDTNLIDPTSTNQYTPSSWNVGTGAAPNGGSLYGTLTNYGDFVGYKFTSAELRQVHIDVAPLDVSLAHPDIIIKNNRGEVVAFNYSVTPWSNAHVDFQAVAGQTYSVIVGSENAGGRGRFSITESHNSPVPQITGSTFTFVNSDAPGMQLGRMVVQWEDVNSGAFRGLYYDVVGLATTVFGTISHIHTNSGGETVSDVSFYGTSRSGSLLSIVQFNGEMVGMGGSSPMRRRDQMTGTLFTEVLDTTWGGVLFVWGGPSQADDFWRMRR